MSGEASVLNDELWEEKEKSGKGKYQRADERWTGKETTMLMELYNDKKSIRHISGKLQRPPDAIKSKLEELGIIVKKDDKN